MNKQEFLTELRKGLSGLPHDDIEESINFYSEMIDDRIEEGIPESEAVSDVGSVDEAVSQILSDIPLAKIVKKKIKPKKKLSVWVIVLLILGSPLWISILIALFAVILSVYVVLWAVIVCLWAVFVSMAACVIAGIGIGIAYAYEGDILIGIAMTGLGLLCAGLAIFMFFGCIAATKGACKLTKKIALGIKKCFIKKEKV